GAAFFTLFILPHFLKRKDISTSKERKLNFIDRFSRFSFEKNYWIIGTILILGVISLFTFRKVQFEGNISSFGYVPPALGKAEADLERITGDSLKNVYLVTLGDDLNQALQKQERISGQLQDMKNKKVIREISSAGWILLSDSVQEHRAMLWKKFWTPEKIKIVSETLLREGEKKKFKSSAFNSFLASIKNEPRKPDPAALNSLTLTILSDWVSKEGKKYLVTSIIRTGVHEKQNVIKIFEDKPEVVLFDRQLMTEKFVENVNHDFDSLVKLSMIFVTILLFIAFGRIEIALITAFPMYFAWLITLGFMGLTGIKFNIFNIILSSFVFGLGVDYSILMMRGLLFDYKYGLEDLPSFKTSIFLSSVTTLFGVCALFFARHPALNSIALISLVGILAVVLISYTFQPLFANMILMRRMKEHKFPITAEIFIKTLLTWGNIVFIALIMVIAGLILNLLFFIPRKKKEYIFHSLFSVLCKVYISVSFPSQKTIIDRSGGNYREPAIIIGNHQSLIETPAFLRLHPKILMLTNEWVWTSPLFGPVARLACFFNVERGLDPIMDKLREKVREGYSIVIFPEGHRSSDYHIQRFHRGAFYLAEQLQIDIMPVVVYGSGDFLHRGAFWGKPNRLIMTILPRVHWDDLSFGKTYTERARNIRKFYISAYEKISAEEGTGYYFRKTLVLNYLFKGPVLEWYLRVKMHLSGYYQIYNEYLPRRGMLLDLGCGYGYISYMLWLTSNHRKIIGVDYDQEKINVASHCYLKNDSIHFICSDLSTCEIIPADGIILSDVLHYLTETDQVRLLNECFDKLNAGGVLLIREADRDIKELHRGTRFTEFLSTRLIGFNKTREDKNELFFTSFQSIEKLAIQSGLTTEIVDESKHTSNRLMVIRKKIMP
ncbi:MAG: 1-acyl-sn-glycerol-3-phosphate acyltransferase, partial [Bacteroidota bacterium]|nr:1-acyl-sn-glycerol-3-phosphate acyltransferase [Bacteroidota bacterium]